MGSLCGRVGVGCAAVRGGRRNTAVPVGICKARGIIMLRGAGGVLVLRRECCGCGERRAAGAWWACFVCRRGCVAFGGGSRGRLSVSVSL